MDPSLGDVNNTVTVHNSTILNSSNHKNDKHEKNKSYYCPFCEHCNSSIENKNDVLNSINEAGLFLNRLTETIAASKYLASLTPDIAFKSLNFVENVIDVILFFKLNLIKIN